MKTLLFSVLLIFSVGCYALPECKGSPKEISDYSEVENWSNCKGDITFGNNGGDRAGNHYFGSFKNGKLQGQGTYTWANDGKYVGEFKDGKSHGQGTFTFADGRKYVGEFKDDKQHGQGTFTWPDGENYIGEWKDGLKHGQGTYTFADGRKYVGEYKDNKLHGWGKFTQPNGEVQEGIWKKSELIKSKESIVYEKNILKLKKESRIKPLSGLIMSSEEKCVNAQIEAWNATENKISYQPEAKFMFEYSNNAQIFLNKEEFLAYAWRQCKEK